jgi:hypothetical protein
MVPPLPEERPVLPPANSTDTGGTETSGADSPAAPGPDPELHVYQAACPALLSGRIEARPLEPIEEEVCGIRSPLAVSAVVLNGQRVELTGTPILNCRMASELAEWAEALNAYTEAALDSGLSQILTGTAYQCRPRNNQDGGLYSEHGFGNAIDVSGVLLEDGSRMVLPEGW